MKGIVAIIVATISPWNSLRKWYYLWMQKGGRAPKGMWTVRSGLWLPSPLYQHDLRASCKNTKNIDWPTEILKYWNTRAYVITGVLNKSLLHFKPRMFITDVQSHSIKMFVILGESWKIILEKISLPCPRRRIQIFVTPQNKQWC